MRVFACIIALLLLLPAAALANGYDTWTPPIAWSPDGKMLCVVVANEWPQRQVDNDGSVLVLDEYGRIQYHLDLPGGGSPCYSPDGKWLALVSGGSVHLFSAEDYELERVVDAAGEALDVSFTGSADDYRLAISSGPRFYGSTISTGSASGGEMTEMPKPAAGDSAFSPRSDGEHTAFLLQGTAADSPAYERVYSLDRNGNPQQLTRPQRTDWDYHESNISFMPDGRLLFQRGGWGDWHIYALDIDSGREGLLVPDAQQPSLSADGGLLAFTRRDRIDKLAEEYDWELPTAVWVRDLATGTEYRISEGPRQAEHPVLSPDGRKLAWLEDMDGEPRLVLRSVIGFTGVRHRGGPMVVKQLEEEDTQGLGRLTPRETEQTTEEMTDSTAEPLSPKAMDITFVKLECTNGDIILAVHHEWNPIGAARFIELVNAGFYDGAPWFRVIDGFVAQCGISADWRMNAEYDEATIPDEPVLVGNTRGMVAFGKTAMPNSRTTHIYINYVDNSERLDPQGFSAFAEVWQGMDVADGLYRCEFNDQASLNAEGGMELFREKFPEADYIQLAYVLEGDAPEYRPVTMDSPEQPYSVGQMDE